MTRVITRTTTLLAVGAVLAAVALGVVVASAVGGGGDGTANGSVPVEDVSSLAGSWKAVNSVGSPQEVIGEVRLRFEGDRLVVETGCNAARGTVEVVESRLVAGPMMSTRMGCEAALMEQESWLVAMVSSRPLLERSGPYLYVSWDTPDAQAPEGGATSSSDGSAPSASESGALSSSDGSAPSSSEGGAASAVEGGSGPTPSGARWWLGLEQESPTP